MFTGTAERPYVYRQLFPDIVNYIAGATPRSLQDYLFHRIYPSDQPVKFGVLAELPVPSRQAWFFRFLLLYLFTFFAALTAVIAMYLVCEALALPTPVSVLAPVLMILFVPYVYIFAYDYSELAFLAAATWIALRFDWWWLLPVAALGAWNKESFLFFMPMLYPFLRQRASSRLMAASAVVTLTLVCGLVYLHMRMHFAQNPGSTVIVQWKEHFIGLFNPFDLFTSTDEVYGIRMVRVSTLFPTILVIWSFVRVWKRLPRFVRQHGLLAIGINAPLYLLFCSPGEYRDLSFLSIIFLLVTAWNLKEWIERSTRPADISAKY
jgi:hypothetical protein